MALRRDVSRSLLAAWDNERRFIDTVRRNIEAGRLTKKAAEDVIVLYYRQPERLLLKLDDWAHR